MNTRIRDWHGVRVITGAVTTPNPGELLTGPYTIWVTYLTKDLTQLGILQVLRFIPSYDSLFLFVSYPLGDLPEGRQMPYNYGQPYPEETEIGQGWPPQVMSLADSTPVDGFSPPFPTGSFDRNTSIFFEPDGYLLAYVIPSDQDIGENVEVDIQIDS